MNSKFNSNEKTVVVSFARWIIRWRWQVLMCSVIFMVLAATGGRFIAFNSDQDIWFSDDNPQLQALNALEETFTKDKNVFIAIEAKDSNIFSRETLAAIEELTARAWKTPFSTRVDAITNFQYVHSEGDELFVDDLVRNASTKTDTEIVRIEKIALNEPFLLNRLINKIATVTGINITVKIPDGEVGEAAKKEEVIRNFVRPMVSEFEAQHPNLKTYLSGMVMLSGAFREAAKQDGQTLIPLMFLILIIAIWITTRSLSGMIASLIVLVFSIFTALGLAGWLGIHLDVLSASAPTMILTLAVADSIHILVSMLQAMRRGISKQEAIVESLRVNLLPVFITSLTTVIGFLTLNFNDSPPFHSLGNIAAVGISAAFLFAVFTLPALMAVFPVKVKKSQSEASKNGWIDALPEFVIRNQKRLLWASALTVLLITPFSLINELNDQWVEYFDRSISFRVDTDFMTENLTGIYNIEYSLSSGEPYGITNPDYLKKLEEFELWFKSHPQVIHVNSFVEVMRQVNKSMNGDNPAFYRIPDNRNEAAQYLLLYEMSLPYGLDLNSRINVDKSQTRFTVTVENLNSNELIALTERGERWLEEYAPHYMVSQGASRPLMFAHLGKRQINGMLKGGFFAILLITGVLIFALRSVKYGFLSLLPNLTPILFAFGIWGLTVGQINSAVAVVIGMTLGIIVDDTVHILTKYLRARRIENKSAEDAVRYAFASVGRAVIVTTIILTAGFLVLSLSGFEMNGAMAKITALTICLALVTDLLMLPVLLIAISHKKTSVAPDLLTDDSQIRVVDPVRL
jgi:predicted RND superfamily exporter protein